MWLIRLGHFGLAGLACLVRIVWFGLVSLVSVWCILVALIWFIGVGWFGLLG